MKRLLIVTISAAALLAAGGCDSDECDIEQVTSCGPGKLCKAGEDGTVCVPGCLAENAATCGAGQVCEQLEDGSNHLCFAPVYAQGKITNAMGGQAIAGARVTPRDDTGGVVGEVATSDSAGGYQLRLPVPRKADGTLAAKVYTLRADASTYASFPSGMRPALPLETASAVQKQDGSGWVIENAATQIALIPLGSTANLGTVRGKVQAAVPAGALVVASNASGGASGIADRNGDFVVFNAPSGEVTVRGYLKGTQLSTASATVPGGGEVKDVLLSKVEGKPLAAVSGNLGIVNAPGGSKTSIVLAVKETFIETLEVGEVPAGLRANDVSGAFSIADVPDGNYVILPSLDNDLLVRDPNPNNGGTALVYLTVENGVMNPATLPGFKATEALVVRSPGANGVENASATPTFVWADDSSEDGYQLRVYDALGTLVWEDLAIPSPSGSADVSLAYGGPPLTAGMIYQFRATSMKNGAPITRTEQLRGVFLVQ